MATLKIGNGFDAHRFGEGDHVILGGVKIPFDKGLEAHSDGDVVLHAICDAVLGALGKGDIGKHFPDTDTAFKNIDSRVLLRNVTKLMAQENFKINNLDVTIIAQAPKMSPYIDDMQFNIAEDLNAGVSSVNIKATTTEKMGFAGRGEGIAVMASVLLASS